MRITYCLLGAGLAFAVTAVPLRAHHAFAAEFDANRPVKLSGTVSRVEWINPHAWIHLDVKKPGGKVEIWQIEAGAPNALLRRGWTKTSLKVGTAIVVDGYASKDGTHKANGRDITLPDGRKLFVGSSGSGAPDERKK